MQAKMFLNFKANNIADYFRNMLWFNRWFKDYIKVSKIDKANIIISVYFFYFNKIMIVTTNIILEKKTNLIYNIVKLTHSFTQILNIQLNTWLFIDCVPSDKKSVVEDSG